MKKIGELPLEIYSFKCPCGHVDVELNEEERDDRKILSKHDIWYDYNESGEYFCEECHRMIKTEYVGTERILER